MLGFVPLIPVVVLEPPVVEMVSVAVGACPCPGVQPAHPGAFAVALPPGGKSGLVGFVGNAVDAVDCLGHAGVGVNLFWLLLSGTMQPVRGESCPDKADQANHGLLAHRNPFPHVEMKHAALNPSATV